MTWDHDVFRDRLDEAVDAYDETAVNGLIVELVAHVRASGEVYPAKPAGQILQQLRRKRFFSEMERAADALVYSGQDDAKVRRLYAQALLDQRKLRAGINELTLLESETADNPGELREARGLLGRAYKQAYVDARAASERGAPVTERGATDLRQSIEWYHGVYEGDAEQVWHGINTVAMVKRAARDSVDLTDLPDADAIADAILDKVEDRRADQTATAWDYGTAAEACIARGRDDDALKWLKRYVDGSDADAFELASTLRQLEEVWQLDPTTEPGRRMIPYLQAELLKREGGHVDMDAGTSELRALTELVEGDDGTFEGVLGTESFENVKWWLTGQARARSVAHVSDAMGKTQGTAFVVKAEDIGLEAAAEGELLLVTNSHVVSQLEDERQSMRPADACVNFEIEPLDEPLAIAGVLAESGRHDLDFTVFRTAPPVTEREPVPLARTVPVLEQDQPAPRVYIIGHPGGHSLRFSIYDNRLLNHDSPYLHYRTPTQGGSSGSPVMNKNWQLIGLHHLGDKQVELPGKPGKHPANEGIVIHQIIEDVEGD